MKDCVFCKIVAGEIATDFVYQDEDIAVFPNNNPKAPLHLLFIPKKHVEDLRGAENETVIKIVNNIIKIVNERRLEDKGYRVVINGGKAKLVPHLHFHLLGEITVEREV